MSASVPYVTSEPSPASLLRALALSVLLHGLALSSDRLVPSSPLRRINPPLEVTLPERLPERAAAPALIAPEAVKAPATAASRPPPPKPPPSRRGGFSIADLTNMASRQVAKQLYYPQEAAAAGLEGEALVTLYLDEAGNAQASRLERSSGHAILDEAALRAARAVRALPQGEASELLLPVRFRLR